MVPGFGKREGALRRRIATNVRRLRVAKKLTIEAAAQEAGLHTRHWQKVEGAEVNPTLRTLVKIAITLGVSEQELLT